MDGAVYMSELKKGFDVSPDENVFQSIWKEYEKVIIQSLITSFGLDFLVHDQHGGDVDTILNVRKIGTDEQMTYKSGQNAANYAERGQYDQSMSRRYHSDKKYIEMNAKVSAAKKSGELTDAYTGKKVALNANIDLDHVIAAKEIHDDPGRILAGLDGTDLANCEENLKPTDSSINRSLKQDDKEEYLIKWGANAERRKSRIGELSAKGNLTEKEQNELNKLKKLDEINPDLMLQQNKNARKRYETKLAKAYYASPKFAKDAAAAAGKRGAEMGIRQALGFVFVEVWMCTKKEIQAISAGSGLDDMLNAVGVGIKKGFESARQKYKELIAKIEEGFTAGALASLTTTICNIFFTTAKNLVKCIRQIYASVVQAGKVLLFNPDGLRFGDRLKTAGIILATGASVLVGTTVGELVGKTPIGEAPVIGSVVTVFCSTLISGLLSCTLLIFLDRSKMMNHIFAVLNSIPSEVNDYREIAVMMENIAAKLEKIDIEGFGMETKRFADVADKISQCSDEYALNNILLGAYRELGINIPWEGDFDTFMSNRNNHLVFE